MRVHLCDLCICCSANELKLVLFRIRLLLAAAKDLLILNDEWLRNLDHLNQHWFGKATYQNVQVIEEALVHEQAKLGALLPALLALSLHQ